MNLERWLKNYISDPFNPENNFKLGLCYEEINQTASAAGFFLRSIEFGDNDENIYEALLKISLCFERQGNRVFTIKGLLLRAISLLPKRPEAYFLLSRIYERNKDWQESYTTATIGYELATDPSIIKSNVEYPGKYGFLFEKAVSGWWIGLCDESIHLFRVLNREYNLDAIHKQAVTNNLQNLGNNWKEPSIYYKDKYSKLRYKFDGCENIERNYSQSYQDLFVLMMLGGKKVGTYLEIGSADPFYGNNTALLEEIGWDGISIDINNDLVNSFKTQRKNEVIQSDATKVQYSKILKSEVIDYLQIDCDPPAISFEVLKRIPFNTHKFAVITFEHDHYNDDSQSIRDKSRKYLKSFGYQMVVNNIAPDDYCSYEDWWIHPDLIDSKILEQMSCINDVTKKAEKYIYNQKMP